jgi:hypothetical protein
MADTIRIPGDDARAKRPPRDERSPRADEPPRDDATSRRGDGGAAQGGTGSGSSSRPRPRRRPKDDTLIVESLTGLYGMVGAGIAGTGQIQGNAGLVAAGVNVTLQGEMLAEQWLALGEQVPAVRRALEGMLQTGAVSVVVMGNIGIALPILAASGVVPQQVGNMFLRDDAIEAGKAYQAMQAQAAAAQAAANGMSGA